MYCRRYTLLNEPSLILARLQFIDPHSKLRTPDPKLRTPDSPNSAPQTPNSALRTPNCGLSKLRTPDPKLRNLMNGEPHIEETLYTLDVPAGYVGDERLDQYITGFMANATRTKVQKGIKEGRVTINGSIVQKGSHRVQAGDIIVCRLERPPPVKAAPEAIPLDVTYEDEFLLVVNKPAGMVVHPAYGNRTGTLVNALLYYLGGSEVDFDDGDGPDDDEVGLSMVNARPRSAEGIDVRPGIVHRIDKDTSGLLVIAKDDVTHAHLAGQFARRSTRRTYEALVWGYPDPATGRVETWLGRDPRDRRKMAVVREEKGKHAITNYETLGAWGDISLLTFKLETGRTHQIRIHAEHIGHPILGDSVYGGAHIRYGIKTARRKTFYNNIFKIMPRQGLHARTLGFVHPHSGAELNFESPLPADMVEVIDRLQRVP